MLSTMTSKVTRKTYLLLPHLILVMSNTIDNNNELKVTEPPKKWQINSQNPEILYSQKRKRNCFLIYKILLMM